MLETADDLVALQQLLDDSYAAGGPHLLSIITPDRRLSAAEVADRLQGMCLLVLGTVTRDGRPLLGPVDGIFYRGAFYFGSSADSVRWRHVTARPHVSAGAFYFGSSVDSVRWRHLTARPHVSATHLPREELSVTVHGRATPIDVSGEDGGAFRAALIGVYEPKYGPGWTETFLDTGPVYARIDADRMITLHLAES